MQLIRNANNTREKILDIYLYIASEGHTDRSLVIKKRQTVILLSFGVSVQAALLLGIY